MRIAVGESRTVMAIILGVVALIPLFSAWMLQNKKLLNAYQLEKKEQ